MGLDLPGMQLASPPVAVWALTFLGCFHSDFDLQTLSYGFQGGIKVIRIHMTTVGNEIFAY